METLAGWLVGSGYFFFGWYGGFGGWEVIFSVFAEWLRCRPGPLILVIEFREEIGIA